MQATGNSRLQRISHLLENPEGSLRSHIFSQEQYLFTQLEIRKKLLRSSEQLRTFFYDESFFSDHQFTEGEKQALFDLQYYLKDDLLVKLDRASMYYGLECRSPLLDYRVVEYALSLTSSLKKRDGKSKWLLKEILRRYLPDKAIDRPKWGFSIPLGIWMKTHLRYLMDDFLNPEIIQEANLVNYAYVHKLKTDFFQGKNYLYNRLWVIIVLHKWWKQNIR
jgi:asparagine synthase (glutamine-hydrolysing)